MIIEVNTSCCHFISARHTDIDDRECVPQWTKLTNIGCVLCSVSCYICLIADVVAAVYVYRRLVCAAPNSYDAGSTNELSTHKIIHRKHARC